MAIPRLRFEGFERAWEERTLGEVSSTFSGGTPTSSNKSFYEGKIPFIKSGEISQSNTAQFINELALTNSSAKLVKKGDLLYALYGATSGQVAIAQLEGAINQAVLCIRSKRLVTNYLYNFLLFKKEEILSTYLQGGQGNLSASIMKNIRVPVPELKEQTKIACFLSVVDYKIAQLTQGHELLSEYKKGMMQQLFSQKLRFKADDGSDFEDWEERTLGEVSSTFSGGTPTSSNKSFYEGKIPFIKSGEISQSNTAQFINELALTNSSAKLVKKGDLLYALYGATSGQVAIAQLEGAINQAVLCIRSKRLVTNYLYNFLLFKKEEILSTYLQGGQGNLSASIMKKIDIPTPCLEEQTKIANFLSAIDQKIDNVAAQIDQAKVWKKGLLQQMFV